MDLRLLEKFFNNQCTPEEVSEVLRCFNVEEEKLNTLSAIEAYWQHFEDKVDLRKEDLNIRLEKIHHYLINQELPSQQVSYQAVTTQKSVRKIGFGFRIAAILVLALLASISLHHTFPPPIKAEQVAYITKINPAGQKTAILLEDGSKVILNAASTLTYPEHFSSAERRLQLQGEAFFEVAKDANRPFTVVANGIATTALGTSFNIRAYEDEKNISIALATGKVKVDGNTHDGGNYELHPGESITYDKEEKNFIKAFLDPKEQLAWKEGIIYFHDASFQQIINKLEQWYGVSFTVENHPGPSWKYTGEFDNENLENVLLSISYAKKFDFEINNDTVKIVFH
jgi:transmembrane sensor